MVTHKVLGDALPVLAHELVAAARVVEDCGGSEIGQSVKKVGVLTLLVEYGFYIFLG